jgi:shikimate dehydrogenase
VSGARLSATTTVAAVIGSPVRHSLSPAIHNAGFAAAGLDWAFVAFEVVPGGGAAALGAMRSLGLGGLSVTMPHKDDVAAAADLRSPTVERLGAANCVVPTGDGRLRAENTDGGGFVASLRDAGIEPDDLRCCVVGAGGAARAVVLALAEAGAAEVSVVNRTPANAERAAGLAGAAGRVVAGDDAARAVAGADLVVNATPIGMGDDASTPIDPRRLGAGQVVADLVYYPLDTPFLQAAASAGCRTVDGLGMLVHQAALAFEAWTGEAAPVEAMRAAAVAELRERDFRGTS